MSTSKEKTEDIRNAQAEKERQLIAEIVRNALAQTFEGLDYSVKGAGVTELVNVSTSIVTGTQTSATILPGLALELSLNSNFTDTSSYASAIMGSNSNGFILPGQFGSAGWKCNTPVQPPTQPDALGWFSGSTPTPAQWAMNTTAGFSWSFWINPQDISALSRKRTIIEKREDSNNMYCIQIDSSGILYFFVKKSGTDYKAQVSGFTTGSWQHVGATFNGATNSAIVYRNAVAGVSSSATDRKSVV